MFVWGRLCDLHLQDGWHSVAHVMSVSFASTRIFFVNVYVCMCLCTFFALYMLLCFTFWPSPLCGCSQLRSTWSITFARNAHWLHGTASSNANVPCPRQPSLSRHFRIQVAVQPINRTYTTHHLQVKRHQHLPRPRPMRLERD